jgi:hypothetical protein
VFPLIANIVAAVVLLLTAAICFRFSYSTHRTLRKEWSWPHLLLALVSVLVTGFAYYPEARAVLSGEGWLPFQEPFVWVLLIQQLLLLLLLACSVGITFLQLDDWILWRWSGDCDYYWAEEEEFPTIPLVAVIVTLFGLAGSLVNWFY